jgi:hypothetical protein
VMHQSCPLILLYIAIAICRLMQALNPLNSALQVGTSRHVDEQFHVVKAKVWEELKLHSSLMEIQGCLEPIIGVGILGANLQGNSIGMNGDLSRHT